MLCRLNLSVCISPTCELTRGRVFGSVSRERTTAADRTFSLWLPPRLPIFVSCPSLYRDSRRGLQRGSSVLPVVQIVVRNIRVRFVVNSYPRVHSRASAMQKALNSHRRCIKNDEKYIDTATWQHSQADKKGAAPQCMRTSVLPPYFPMPCTCLPQTATTIPTRLVLSAGC
jgi:hypothetical protein